MRSQQRNQGCFLVSCGDPTAQIWVKRLLVKDRRRLFGVSGRFAAGFCGDYGRCNHHSDKRQDNQKVVHVFVSLQAPGSLRAGLRPDHLCIMGETGKEEHPTKTANGRQGWEGVWLDGDARGENLGNRKGQPFLAALSNERFSGVFGLLGSQNHPRCSVFHLWAIQAK